MEYGYRYGEENLFWSWIWRGPLRIKDEILMIGVLKICSRWCKKKIQWWIQCKNKKCNLSNTKSMVRPFGHRTDSRTIVSLTTKIMIMMMMMMMMMAVVVVVGVIMLIMITNLWLPSMPALSILGNLPQSDQNIHLVVKMLTSSKMHKQTSWQSAMELWWFFLFLAHFLSFEHRKICKTASRYHR